VLSWETVEKNCYGTELPKVYDDWDGIKEVTSIPDSALHRPVDKLVLRMSSANSEAIRTAIVCPPCIYGPGRGPDNQRSLQVYEAAKTILKRRQAFLPLKGENVWHEVHVHDLSDVFVLLGEAAANGLIDSEYTSSLSADELTQLHPYSVYIWASNSRGKAIRAKKLLGWQPHGKPLKEELPDIVEGEARALGLIEGHAAKVTQ
jgi:nucleoside-diphosphate-sugar epimerase